MWWNSLKSNTTSIHAGNGKLKPVKWRVARRLWLQFAFTQRVGNCPFQFHGIDSVVVFNLENCPCFCFSRSIIQPYPTSPFDFFCCCFYHVLCFVILNPHMLRELPHSCPLRGGELGTALRRKQNAFFFFFFSVVLPRHYDTLAGRDVKKKNVTSTYVNLHSLD